MEHRTIYSDCQTIREAIELFSKELAQTRDSCRDACEDEGFYQAIANELIDTLIEFIDSFQKEHNQE